MQGVSPEASSMRPNTNQDALEALKPGIDFSFLAMKVLDGIFFQ